MKILSIQEAYGRKFQRQKKIRQLQYNAAGHCAHIGKISPGCYQCFTTSRFSLNVNIGAKCNLNCPYCPSNKNDRELDKEAIRQHKLQILRHSSLPGYNPSRISFTGGGEPLIYIEAISEYMRFYRDLTKNLEKKPWYYLYTNGVLADTSMLLRLKDLGFDEIRFHLGASNFAKSVYNNLKQATRLFKATSVETPAWPLHRKKLFSMLPIINDLGVKHLNITEIEINELNYQRIRRFFPRGEIYQCYEMHLDDGGLVYEIIEEVLRKKYIFSVLDCNCFVKSIQRGQAKWVAHEDVEELCARYKD